MALIAHCCARKWWIAQKNNFGCQVTVQLYRAICTLKDCHWSIQADNSNSMSANLILRAQSSTVAPCSVLPSEMKNENFLTTGSKVGGHDMQKSPAEAGKGAGVEACDLVGPSVRDTTGVPSVFSNVSSVSSANSLRALANENVSASNSAVTFFRRVLPSPPATAFASQEGQKIFQEALADGTMAGFFKLMQEFRTQDEPAFCGLASVAMVLNALAIDPRRAWKGPWRYFHETLLDCCTPLEKVKEEGIVLQQAACLARCNGARCQVISFDDATLEQFREDVVDAVSSGLRHVVVSYSRKQFLQTGDGHFSPIGGYHKGRDLVLILDTARFKYPPHWVPLTELYKAMGQIDRVTGRPRGYMILDAPDLQQSVLFTLGRADRAWPSVLKTITKDAIPKLATRLSAETTAERWIAAVLHELSPRDVASFMAVREEGGCQSGWEAGPTATCTLPAAASQLLAELHTLPLYKLVDKLLGMAPSSGCGECRKDSKPFFAERLTMLLLLIPSEAWDSLSNPQAREEVEKLMVPDETKGGIVSAELAYLKRQLAELPVLDMLEASSGKEGCGCRTVNLLDG
eukprot:jgi/Botrbrau1/17457/Bobra.0054s0046.2